MRILVIFDAAWYSCIKYKQIGMLIRDPNNIESEERNGKSLIEAVCLLVFLLSLSVLVIGIGWPN